jgi:hypothetical protein
LFFFFWWWCCLFFFFWWWCCLSFCPFSVGHCVVFVLWSMITPLVSWNFSYEMVNFVYMNNYQKPIFEGGIVSRGGWLKVVNLWERRTDWELKISEKRRTSCSHPWFTWYTGLILLKEWGWFLPMVCILRRSNPLEGVRSLPTHGLHATPVPSSWRCEVDSHPWFTCYAGSVLLKVWGWFPAMVMGGNQPHTFKRMGPA